MKNSHITGNEYSLWERCGQVDDKNKSSNSVFVHLPSSDWHQFYSARKPSTFYASYFQSVSYCNPNTGLSLCSVKITKEGFLLCCSSWSFFFVSTSKERFIFFQCFLSPILKQWSVAHIYTETGFACCYQPSCSYWTLRGPFWTCFHCKRSFNVQNGSLQQTKPVSMFISACECGFKTI